MKPHMRRANTSQNTQYQSHRQIHPCIFVQKCLFSHMILPGVWCSGMFLAYAFFLINQIHFILSVYFLSLFAYHLSVVFLWESGLC